MKNKKLKLRSSAERGDKKLIFIERDLLINYQGPACFRSIDYQLNDKNLESFVSSEYGKLDIIIIHHAKELALAQQTLDQLNKIDETLKESIVKKHPNLLDQLNCIHHQDADGNEALCVSCSCHPSKGGLFLNAAVKYSLSLSQCYYLYQKEEFAEVAKRYGISTLKIDNI
jgi:histidinol phosphatase-like enzyme